MNILGVCLLVAVLSINIIAIAAFTLMIIHLERNVKSDKELKEKMFLFSLPVNDEENFLLLDKIIQNECQVWQIYNVPSFEDDYYMNKGDQDKMLRGVLSQVLKKVSPVYLNKLKYIYNEEVIEDIVFEKVRDAVLNFTVEINGTYSDLKNNHGGHYEQRIL